MATSATLSRVLRTDPVDSWESFLDREGGRGLDAALRLGPAATRDEVEASGLRGRGGAGFPTGVKWATVERYRSASLPTTVVVNGAEGEPSTFKDRAIVRGNPFIVVEGALIAARSVGADRVVFALKQSFDVERRALEHAVVWARRAGWCDGIALDVVTGPGEYLFGEETALLEVLDGRPPLPRVAPPFRRGVDDEGFEPDTAAGSEMARPGPDGAAPTLVNNVETLANVPSILARGAQWFRSAGTDRSPGTVVCTVVGAVRTPGVGEVPMGTPLAEVIELIGGGARSDRRLVAALPGVANPFVLARDFGVPVSHEGLEEVGSGLGSAGFLVLDEDDDPVAVAAGAARFLAVESCGQCTPCKQDGLALAALLADLSRSEADEEAIEQITERVRTVTDEARCFLAHQQQRVIGSALEHFEDAMRSHLDGRVEAREPIAIVPLVDLTDGTALFDSNHLDKQPDWSFDVTDSGKAPVDRLRGLS